MGQFLFSCKGVCIYLALLPICFPFPHEAHLSVVQATSTSFSKH